MLPRVVALAAGAALLAVAAGGALAGPSSQNAENGQQLFASFGCAACHGATAQGLVGPKLAGTDLSFDEVLLQLRQPRQAMPAFGPSIVSDDQAFDIYAYLRGLEGKPVPERTGSEPPAEPPVAPAEPPAEPAEPPVEPAVPPAEPGETPQPDPGQSSTGELLVAEGQELFNTMLCASCHGPEGQGLIGPRIAGTLLTFDEVLTQLRTPRELMPPFSADVLSDDQAFAIYAYLQVLGGNPLPERPGADEPAAEAPAADEPAVDEPAADELEWMGPELGIFPPEATATALEE